MTDSTRTRWALRGARTLTGAAVAVGAVVAVVAGAAAPWPSTAHAPLEVVVAPTPSAAVAVCDGAVLAAGRVSGSADEIAAITSPTPVVAAEGEVEEVSVQADAVQGSEGVPAFIAPPRGRDATSLAAATSARVSGDEYAGYTADACRPALFESWLAGGSTQTGASDLVLISNPGEVTATVDITVYGATGETAPPGGAGVSIPARAQRVIPLAGLALGEDSPVVRVVATGAPVRASMQSSLIRTLVPGGLDQQSAIAFPMRTQVVPGVVVVAPPAEAGTADSPTLLRLLSPSASGEATVTVTAIGGTEPVLPATTVPVGEGTPTEVDLSGLAQGAYVVTVVATTPVVAAVWQTTGFGAGSDFAWLTSAPALEGPTLVAVPSGPSPTLQLANPGADDATVALHAISGAGSDRAIRVPAGGSASIALSASSVWQLDPGESVEVRGQVTFAASDALAGYAVWPSDAAVPPVRVYP
ncbi:MAG: DUF5719 family protein [Microbacterium sp.]|uniref:DUF5719 family protein n=1 Tax=Microbacterium sp. TaxID=51671 RepID=UPI0039E4B44E